MDSKRVAEVLFAQFGFKEFLTRDIPPDVMHQLTDLMDIVDVGHVRNTKVGRYIGSLEGPEYALETGQRVRVVVTRPDDKRYNRRFRFISSDTVSHQLHR